MTHPEADVPIVTVPADLVINGKRLPDEAVVAAYAAAVLTDNPAVQSAIGQAQLLKAFIADNPVILTAAEAQQAAAWIESTRKTLAAMEDERKPKVGPLNAALKSINERYRLIREPLDAMLAVVCKRWNSWDAEERKRREAIAAEARRAAEEAATRAQALIDQADDAVAAADVGACEDVGSAVVDAQQAVRNADKLDRAAARAVKATSVRVASTLGGKAMASRRKRVIVIDDACAAVKAIGLTEKITLAIRQSAEAFEEVHGELPAGTRETFIRSI